MKKNNILIHLQAVQFAYEQSRPVLAGIDFQLRQEEREGL